MSEIDILKRSLRDFFTPKMLKLAVVPLIITMVVIYLLFFGVAHYFIDALKMMAEDGTIANDDAPFYMLWLAYLLGVMFKYAITSTLTSFLIYTLGAILLFHISVIFSLLIIGFLTPIIIKELHKRHYSNLELKPYGTLAKSLGVFLSSTAIMLLLYIIFIPLYFIPLLNIIAFYLPLYYFFHKLLNYDVSSNILSSLEYKNIYAKSGDTFRIRTLFLYLISTIPFITLFVAVFYALYLSNAYFVELQKAKADLRE